MEKLNSVINWIINFLLPKTIEIINKSKDLKITTLKTIELITKQPIICIGIALWCIGGAINLLKRIKN